MCLGLRCDDPEIQHLIWIPQKETLIDKGLKSLKFLLTTYTLTDHLCDIMYDELNPRLQYWKQKYGLPTCNNHWPGKHLVEDEWEEIYAGSIHPEKPIQMAFAEICINWVTILKRVNPEMREFLKKGDSERDLIMWIIFPEAQIYSWAKTQEITIKEADCQFMTLKIPA